MKKTGWIPANQKPVRPGVYEIKGVGYPFHYFDGEKWLHMAEAKPEDFHGRDISNVPAMSKSIAYIKNNPWRGLASPVGAERKAP